ncbi:TPA: DUF551 domain-containing protein [Klebsiella pneumoniae]|nr:DUF551 domain-containing protein [Klebsiella pneumoniae]
MDSEPNCKERKLFCSTDTARMRKVISASAGAEGTPLYRHAQQPVSEYPEVLPCPVLLDPGLRFGKGIKTSTMLAALARRAVYESDMAALSPEEIVEFQARIEDFKVLIAQPAPVVPEEATPDSIEILASARRRDHAVFQWNEDQRNAAADSWNACRAAMLAAAPQSPGGDHATVPGKWIPVSERMPEDEQEVLTINKMGHRFVSFFDKHSGLFFDRLDAPAACCIEHVLVTHWMPLPAAPQEVKGE